MATKKGSDKNDKLNGGAGDDMLFGLGGNDTIDGGGGDDEILAGDGNDLIIGAATGLDAIDGGKGLDTLTYASVATSVTINLGLNGRGSTTKGSLHDTFRNVEIFIGSKDGDFFTGTSAKGGRVYGGDGDDDFKMYGSIMRGDEGFDQLHGNASTTDTFWLQRGKGQDDIYTFTHGQDTIWLSHKDFDLGNIVGYNDVYFTSTTPVAVTNKPQLIYLTAIHELYYDPDGTGPKDIEHIATFHGVDLVVEDFEII